MIRRATPDAIAAAADLLRRGEVVAFPTETVYGLGADATNARAVAQIYAIKARPTFDPLIVHLADAGALRDVADFVPPAARALTQRFWPGPLTIVLRKTGTIPDIVTAGLPSVARARARSSRRPLAHRCDRSAARRPQCQSVRLHQPDCGRARRRTARRTGAAHPRRRALPVGVESTYRLVRRWRPGAAACRRNRAGGHRGSHRSGARRQPTAACRSRPANCRATTHRARRSHSSPRQDRSRRPSAPASPCCSPQPSADSGGFAHVEVLSRDGELTTVAANLFAALRRLDDAGFERIVAVAIPEVGLGRAIMDRLRRASM